MDNTFFRLILGLIACIVLPKLLAIALKIRIVSVLNLLISFALPGSLLCLAIGLSRDLVLFEKVILVFPISVSCLFMVWGTISSEIGQKNIWFHSFLKTCVSSMPRYLLLCIAYSILVLASISPTFHYILHSVEPRFIFRVVAVAVVWGIYSFAGFSLFICAKTHLKTRSDKKFTQ